MSLRKKAKRTRQGNGKFSYWPTHKKSSNKNTKSRPKKPRGQGKAR